MKMRKVWTFVSRLSASATSSRCPVRFLLKEGVWLWNFARCIFRPRYPWRGVKNDKNRIFSESRFEWTKMTGRHQGSSWKVQRRFVTFLVVRSTLYDRKPLAHLRWDFEPFWADISKRCLQRSFSMKYLKENGTAKLLWFIFIKD